MDILSGLVFFLTYFFRTELFLVFPVYLGIKSFLFIKSLGSIIDLAAAVFFVFAIYGNFLPVDWIFVLWLIQKGLFSLLS